MASLGTRALSVGVLVVVLVAILLAGMPHPSNAFDRPTDSPRPTDSR